MKSNKPKVYKVRYNGREEIMTNADVKLIQNAGSKVKILRKATIEETKTLKDQQP